MTLNFLIASLIFMFLRYEGLELFSELRMHYECDC